MALSNGEVDDFAYDWVLDYLDKDIEFLDVSEYMYDQGIEDDDDIKNIFNAAATKLRELKDSL